MTHHSDQERHSPGSAIQLPYPRGGPIHYSSPSHDNKSARPSRRPGTHHAESIASDDSRYPRRERGRYDQRPESPPTDPLTPPMSRRGSLHFNDQHDLSHKPQEECQYDPQDYPDLEDSSVILTPPSSSGTIFNDQNTSIEHGYPPCSANGYQVQTSYNDRDVHLKKVSYPSIPGAQGRVEYYDPQWRLTDANGTVIVDEPEYVPDESQDRYYDNDREADPRRDPHSEPIDPPPIHQRFVAYDLEEQYPSPNHDDGGKTPRRRFPVSSSTKYQNDREMRQARGGILRDSYGLDPRLAHHVHEDQATRYKVPISTGTMKYGQVSNRESVHGVARSYKRDVSPAQSVSSFDSRYSTRSHRAKDPHRAPRSYNQASSESSRESLSPVKGDRRQEYPSTWTRDRSLSLVQRYESRQVSERSRDRSISPPWKDYRRRVEDDRSPDVSSSGSETDYSLPRGSKSGESMAIMVVFKSGTSRSRNSNDSWDEKTFSGPSPVGQALAPATLARSQRAMAQTARTRMAVSLLRSLADSLERDGSAGGNTMTVMAL